MDHLEMEQQIRKEVKAMDSLSKDEKKLYTATDSRTNMVEAVATADGFGDLLDDAAEMTSNLDDLQELRGDMRSLSEQVSGLVDLVRVNIEQMTQIQNEISRLRTDDCVLVEMHERNRALSEEFHERDVLNPVFLSLIGIADRCEQNRNKAIEAGERLAGSNHRAAMRAFEHIRRAREADRIDMENLLENFGVERFETLDDLFDPATQRCIERIVIVEASSHGKIARRILPGYRRIGRIIRQECVAVYVASDAGVHKEKGAAA